MNRNYHPVEDLTIVMVGSFFVFMLLNILYHF